MISKKKSPNDVIPTQERFLNVGNCELLTTAKPTASYVDYETDSDEEFQITQASSGHESFMYKSTTRGKKEGRD